MNQERHGERLPNTQIPSCAIELTPLSRQNHIRASTRATKRRINRPRQTEIALPRFSPDSPARDCGPAPSENDDAGAKSRPRGRRAAWSRIRRSEANSLRTLASSASGREKRTAAPIRISPRARAGLRSKVRTPDRLAPSPALRILQTCAGKQASEATRGEEDSTVIRRSTEM